MEAIFKLFKSQQCKLDVVGLELQEGQYEYTNYLDYCTINALYKVNSKEERKLIQVDFNKHVVSEFSDNFNPDITTFNLGEDGLYEVVHIIIPVLGTDNKDGSLLNYYTDGEQVYKKGTVLKPVDINEILECNVDITNMYKDSIYTFSLCNIKKCFYKVSRDLLLRFCNDKCQRSQESIFNRDVLWMIINTITYLVEKGAFFEAQRILESISGCSSICETMNKSDKPNGCGCNPNKQRQSN